MPAELKKQKTSHQGVNDKNKGNKKDLPETETQHFCISLQQTAKELSEKYQKSQPYKHCRIEELFENSFLTNVWNELKNLEFKEKETDIYKITQTGDLMNLDGLDTNELMALKNVNLLRRHLYSDEFRSFIQNVTGCGPLSRTKIDLSINKYTKGCHLLNHDDVIGTRRVSFILYLPDPSIKWTPELGGGLELYPVKEKGTPENEPTVTLDPTFNSFTFFTVQPGHSFHSVQEVIGDIDRISISGWFHLPTENETGFELFKVETQIEVEKESKSTLEQLLSFDLQDYVACDQDDLQDPLSKEELIQLTQFLNPSYLTPPTISKVGEMFSQDSFVLLSDILNKTTRDAIHQSILREDEGFGNGNMPIHGSGVVSNEWICEGPPHLKRFLKTQRPQNFKVDQESTAHLFSSLAEFLQSVPFKKWLLMVSLCCTKSFLSSRAFGRRFRPGLDYSLAVPNKVPLLHVNLCLTPNNSDNQEAWETGEFGGYTSYMVRHDDQDAAVYQSNTSADEDVLLTLPASFNTMLIVLREKDILHFVKYISALAPGSRWDVDAEYKIPDGE